MNPLTHFYLYAKGHYQKDDLWTDLAHITGDYAGIAPSCVGRGDVLFLLSHAAAEALCQRHGAITKHAFAYFIRDLLKNQNVSRRLGQDPLSLEELLARRFISQLAITEVAGLDLGDPDPAILPLANGGVV